MRHGSGYTLLELLVVLTIMGILISAVPGMALPGVTALSLSGKMQDITSRLAAAHEKAMQTGRTIILSSSDLSVSGVRILLPPLSPEITFFPDGSASAVIITIEYSGRQRHLAIDPITGSAAAQ